ncbi:MAG: hypothetical protein KDK99_08965, partial [Verrucomicrobiales bacterium]|nr:hypothetical protein [Verrucomicrobiales bacterium]
MIPPEMKLAALPRSAIDPPDNPSTPEKVALGRLLFFDPVLSATEKVACSTCHHPRYGWADGRATPLGVGGRGIGPQRLLSEPSGIEPLQRNTPGLLNVGFNGLVSGSTYDPEKAPMFWDAREAGLEAQLLHPIRSRAEMRGDACADSEAVAAMVDRVRRVTGYREKFSHAFPEQSHEPITATTIAAAVAAFERSLIGGNSPFDRFQRGDSTALTEPQQRGMKTFEKAGCIQCHGGPMFSDFKRHVIGVPGTGADDRQALRTPTLRNLGLTAPYLHRGQARTLEDVLIFYEQLMDTVSETLDGGDASLDPPLDPLLKHLHLE